MKSEGHNRAHVGSQDRYLKGTREIADFLDVSERTVYRLRDKHGLQVRKVGGRLEGKVSKVRDWRDGK